VKTVHYNPYRSCLVGVIISVAAFFGPSQFTFAAITPNITSISNPIFVGDSFTVTGSGFTTGSVANFFVATSAGPVNFGPLAYSSQTSTSLTIAVPTSKVTTLGQGVVSVVVINTDQGFTQSNTATAQLFGNDLDGFPNLTAINGVGLAATSTDPSFATDNVQAVVLPSHAVTLDGNGFDTTHGVAIDLFCDCPGGKLSTVFLNPGDAGLSATTLSFTLPSDAVTGPGSFVISNKGAKGDYAIKSNAVSVPIGAAVTVSSVTQSGCTVTVKGSGFAVTGAGLPPFTVINLFNTEASVAVNLGGLGPGGTPKIPLDITGADQFTFSLTGTGALSGASYVQVLNPPFVPFTTSGDTSNGAFTAAGCGPTPTPSHTPAATPTPSTTPTPTPTTAGPTPTTGAATPTPTPTLAPAAALWIENSFSATITEFKGTTLTTPGVSVPTSTVVNQSANLSPDTAGVIFDSSDNQWATVCGNNSGNHGSITEFTAAAVAKLATNSTPAADVVLSDSGTGDLVNCPWAIAFDKSGDLWAANSNEFKVTTAPGYVTEYQPGQLATGHPTPHITLTDPTEFISPTGVVLDSLGNLFVADFGPEQYNTAGTGTVYIFKAATVGSLVPGTNKVKSDGQLFDSSTTTPVNGTFDSDGNLWIADCEANGTGELYMFPKAVLTSGATIAATVFQSTSIATPNGTENTIDCPGGIAFDAQGNLWYTNFLSNHANGAVGEFTKSQLSATGRSTPTPHIFLDGDKTGTNLSQPIGLTFGPGV
jgi:hypothetical protein